MFEKRQNTPCLKYLIGFHVRHGQHFFVMLFRNHVHGFVQSISVLNNEVYFFICLRALFT